LRRHFDIVVTTQEFQHLGAVSSEFRSHAAAILQESMLLLLLLLLLLRGSPVKTPPVKTTSGQNSPGQH